MNVNYYLRRDVREESMKVGEHVSHLLPPLSLGPYMELVIVGRLSGDGGAPLLSLRRR